MKITNFRLITMLILAFLLVGMIFSTSLIAGDKKGEIGLKKKVIVGTFENKASHSWYHGAPPGTGMADMLITALVKSGKFKVYERAALDELLKEKNLSMSDLANPSANVANKLSIGDYLVKATITEFGYKEKKIGGSIKKTFIKGGSLTEYSGRVGVDLRIIDIGTSEVLYAEEVAESEKSRSIGFSTSEFSFGDANRFDDHVVGKATRKVINKIVDKLAEQSVKTPWSGILIVADEFLFIDGGTELGIVSGMQFDVKRYGKEVKHPKTGKVLKVLYDDVGLVKATEVEDGITTVEAVSGSGFQEGDIVRPHKK
jgi:curli biogenesis system outer membrane secretion channel CsgG